MEIAIEEDGDEVFTPMPTHCIRFDCATTFDRYQRQPPAPLFRNKRGFMECSRCHSSYGRG